MRGSRTPPPPPQSGAEFLEAPKKIFWSELTGTKGVREHFCSVEGPEENVAQNFKTGGGGGLGGDGWCGDPPPP